MIFVETMLNQEQLDQLQSIYISQIDKIRSTEDYSNATILKEFVEVFREASGSFKLCDKHINILEKVFIQNAGEHYRKKFKEMEVVSCGEYLENVHKLYKKELNLF